ncbi:Filamin-A [Trichinella pseudospiralis]|uniref:Filamin-A n=2 Tax=Trichinella pseudospiralis TaxID=6337 RepID=A0A0V1EMU3_TRIPS|nr:Filamin-A [Trichinella pseudospiralis]
MSMLSVALAQRGQLHDSLSTGVRRQTIKPPNRPKRKNITACRKKHTNKAASHTVDLAIIHMIFALCQQSITRWRLVEVRGSIQVCSTSRLWAVWMKAFSLYLCALSLHQPPHSLQLIGKYLINGMDLCGISDSKCKQRFQKRQSRLDNISNRLCQRLMKPTNLIKVDKVVIIVRLFQDFQLLSEQINRGDILTKSSLLDCFCIAALLFWYIAVIDKKFFSFLYFCSHFQRDPIIKYRIMVYEEMDFVAIQSRDKAKWKTIQQNTFTRWVNERLKAVDCSVNNLETDLSNGLLLIRLLEVLSKKKLPRYNKKPNFRSQRLENVSVALTFLEIVEGIKLVNIDSSDIVDGRLKLILGLIWTLILHYSIDAQIWDDERNRQNQENKHKLQIPPKQRLLDWLNSKIPGFHLTNLTTQWSDGRLLGALVDSLAPGLCPEWSMWKSANALKNTTIAMDLAEKWLVIPKLIEPEEFINPDVDEMSMMTYLSQYPNAKLQPGAPIGSSVIGMTDSNKLEYPVAKMKRILQIKASGPGLQSGVISGKTTHFDIYMAGGDEKKFAIQILNPIGKSDSVNQRFRRLSGDMLRCEYTPEMVGMHIINIFYDDHSVLNNNPYEVWVASGSFDPAEWKVFGRGIQNSGVRVGDKVDVRILCNGDADASLVEMVVKHSDGTIVPIHRKNSSVRPLKVEGIYQPTHAGLHIVHIKYDGKDFPSSPFEVMVDSEMTSKIRAFGPGLQSGVVNRPCKFTVETNGERCGLGFSVDGPSKAELTCHDNGDGSAEICYIPKACGEYAIHVLSNDVNISGSPYMVEIGESHLGCIPELVKCSGAGISEYGHVCGQRSTFTVDASRAGDGAVKIFAVDSDGMEMNIQQKSIANNVYSCSFVPESCKRHWIMVTFDGQSVPGSPFKIHVSEQTNPNLVRMYGPGLEENVRTKDRNHFFVDCADAGPGKVEVCMKNHADGLPVDVQISDCGNGSYTVHYKVNKPGQYDIYVRFAGSLIPGMPYKVQVKPHLDLSNVVIRGLEERVFINSISEFIVDTTALTKKIGNADVSCTIRSPDGNMARCHIINEKDGTYRIFYSTIVEGKHELQVSYDDVPLTAQPLLVHAVDGHDETRCKVQGAGLKSGLVGIPCRFRVDTKGAGSGKLNIAIEGPSESTISTADNLDGSCTVEYVVSKAGVYKISVTFAEKHIPGSPFTALIEPPLDPNLVRAWGPGLEPKNCRFDLPLQFLVDTTRSGPAQLQVLVDSECGAAPKQPEIVEQAHGVFKVTYYAPAVDSNCKVHILYGGKEIPNSPYCMRVLPKCEAKKVKVRGCGQESFYYVSDPVTLSIDTSEAGYGAFQVMIKDPDGLSISTKHTEKSAHLDELTFIPDIAGTYDISIKYGDEPVLNSPFALRVLPVGGDFLRCMITEGRFETATVGEEQCIKVSTDPAGRGRVTCQILSAEPPTKIVNVAVEQHDDFCLLFYTLPQPGLYRITVRYGGQILQKGQWFIRGELSRRGSVGETLIATPVVVSRGIVEENSVEAEFSEKSWTFASPGPGRLTAKVVMPSKKTDIPVIRDNADGSVCVKYQPSEVGLHELQIKHDGLHVPGSPFSFHVGQVSDGYVTAYGNGLSFGIAGGLSVKIEGPAKADVKCHDNKDGTCSITWIPPAPGEYTVHIQYAGKTIQGSPFKATVSGEGRKRAQISVGSTSEVSIKVTDPEVSVLSASIKSPSGIEEPCLTRRLDSGNLGVSFTPREPGEHLVTVKKRGKLIHGSPFRITVNKADVGDASKVKVTGAGISQAITQEFNSFQLDTRQAGYGGVSVSLEGPSRCEIKYEDNEDKTCKIFYKPFEPGLYVLNVKFADHHVPGSPFTLHCEGKGVGTVTETIEQTVQASSCVMPGDDCHVSLKIPGSAAIDLTASVMNPEGVIEDVELSEDSEEVYLIRFTPKMLGVHTLSVLRHGQHVAGSPFQYTVGPFQDSGTHKVHAGGPGLISGEVNIPCFFNIYSREAGSGMLQIYIEGPSKAKLEYHENRTGDGYVSYCVTKPGDYNVAIKFNEKHIPDSPFKVYISSSTGEARKLEVCSFPDSYGLAVNKPVTFTVVTHGAEGQLDAKVFSPSGATDDCFITPIEEHESYAIRFVPKEVGNHYVHITLDGIHMKDSPFRFRAGPKGEVDPIGVTVIGEGLRSGITGHKCEFIINTCHVGPGNLQVQLDGPSKATLDAYDVEIGYKVRYTPLAPGDYFVTVKYNGIHIPGSPFKINVTGQHLGGSGINESSKVNINTVSKSSEGAVMQVPKYYSDASRVVCQGAGLKKAFASRQNIFNVDCSQAGKYMYHVIRQDLLFVCVMTQKGPAEEMHIKHVGRGIFNINYMVRERGTCFVHILYGNKHVPGSPFMLQI